MKKLVLVSFSVLNLSVISDSVHGMFHFLNNREKLEEKAGRECICGEPVRQGNSEEGCNEFIKSLVKEIHDRAEKVLASTKESKEEGVPQGICENVTSSAGEAIASTKESKGKDFPHDVCKSVANNVKREKGVKELQEEHSLERDEIDLPE